MNFDTWFAKQSLVVRIVLLLLPFVGWFVEIFVRLSAYLKTKNTIDLVILIVFVLFGYGWILNVLDVVWIIYKGDLFYAVEIDNFSNKEESADAKPAEEQTEEAPATETVEEEPQAEINPEQPEESAGEEPKEE